MWLDLLSIFTILEKKSAAADFFAGVAGAESAAGFVVVLPKKSPWAMRALILPASPPNASLMALARRPLNWSKLDEPRNFFARAWSD